MMDPQSPHTQRSQPRSAPSPDCKASLAVRICRGLAFDLNRLVWNAFVNVLGGSMLVPRAVRFAIYRLAGIDVRTVNISPRCTFTHRGVHIGRGTFLNLGVTFEGEPVTIGDRTQIGPQVIFCTAYHPFNELGIAEWGLERRGVEVGDDCYIATRVMILPGVRIASGVAVGAGSVVTHDLTEQGLYAGVPAKLIRRLGPGSAGHG